MIYTAFGNEVQVISGNLDNGDVTVMRDDGMKLDVQMNFLKADGGINEIVAAIEAANSAKKGGDKKMTAKKPEAEAKAPAQPEAAAEAKKKSMTNAEAAKVLVVFVEGFVDAKFYSKHSKVHEAIEKLLGKRYIPLKRQEMKEAAKEAAVVK